MGSITQTFSQLEIVSFSITILWALSLSRSAKLRLFLFLVKLNTQKSKKGSFEYFEYFIIVEYLILGSWFIFSLKRLNMMNNDQDCILIHYVSLITACRYCSLELHWCITWHSIRLFCIFFTTFLTVVNAGGSRF